MDCVKRETRRSVGLAAKLQAFQQLLVFLEVGTLDVVEKFAPAAGHGDQAATAVEILAVGPQVFGEVRNALREQGDLHFGRPGIRFMRPEVADYCGFIEL